MLRIQNKNIHLTKGDTIEIKISSDRTFSVGDQIKLNVVDIQNMGSIRLTKTLTVSTASKIVVFTLTGAETRSAFTEVVNAPKQYWYEFQLNGTTTLVGYDQYGPKLFYVYPEVIEEAA